MPNYRCNYQPGGTYFFTVVSFGRNPWLCEPFSRAALRQAIQYARERYPFKIDAWVLLPEHFHCILTLPRHETYYSWIIKLVKSKFTRIFTNNPSKEKYGNNWNPLSGSRTKKGEKYVWERRFHEHNVRDEKDCENHFHYIHYNPVRHGWCEAPADWPYSTFHRYVKEGYYSPRWGSGKPPDLGEVSASE